MLIPNLCFTFDEIMLWWFLDDHVCLFWVFTTHSVWSRLHSRIKQWRETLNHSVWNQASNIRTLDEVGNRHHRGVLTSAYCMFSVNGSLHIISCWTPCSTAIFPVLAKRKTAELRSFLFQMCSHCFLVLEYVSLLEKISSPAVLDHYSWRWCIAGNPFRNILGSWYIICARLPFLGPQS